MQIIDLGEWAMEEKIIPGESLELENDEGEDSFFNKDEIKGLCIRDTRMKKRSTRPPLLTIAIRPMQRVLSDENRDQW